VRIVQGIGNMPAYHGILPGNEIDAIVDFLVWSGERDDPASGGGP